MHNTYVEINTAGFPMIPVGTEEKIADRIDLYTAAVLMHDPAEPYEIESLIGDIVSDISHIEAAINDDGDVEVIVAHGWSDPRQANEVFEWR
ncbi:hypothetical protein [Azospirillum sp. TSO22-1]|uniref:hypothetical protein n=1 Tax=Azospirillum sp. TSO22-1 TaxID=716789 RepID=UPI000D611C96|nr:hypothetical protein [Azospirillum sp. TSO22-1]PWC45869.1 hypothetical protein TSO221_15050 [Azospirillum sp. TSO22-1]